MSKQIITYVGKKSTCVGKTLWEIVGSLKGFGVGRIIQRRLYVDAYPEQTFYKILEVKAEPNEVPQKIQVFRWPNDHRDKDVHRKTRVICEYVFRGIKHTEPVELFDNSGLPDYRLVPKHLEKNFKATTSYVELKEMNLFPRYIDFPPMLKYIKIKQGDNDPKLKVKIQEKLSTSYRLVKEGEKPTKQWEMGFGKPKCARSVEGVNYDI